MGGIQSSESESEMSRMAEKVRKASAEVKMKKRGSCRSSHFRLTVIGFPPDPLKIESSVAPEKQFEALDAWSSIEPTN